MILLDTNVISELLRTRPDPRVLLWFRTFSKYDVYTSSIVVAELMSGIDGMTAGRRQADLRQAVELMVADDLKGHVLKIDIHTARAYGEIFAHRKKIGRPVSNMDCLIAATAKQHNAVVATRNVDHFTDCGISVIDPWKHR